MAPRETKVSRVFDSPGSAGSRGQVFIEPPSGLTEEARPTNMGKPCFSKQGGIGLSQLLKSWRR